MMQRIEDDIARHRAQRSVYRALYPALIAKNKAALERLLADDFTLDMYDGRRWSRSEFIAAVADGTLEYCTAEEDSIAIDDEAGVLAGRSRVEMSSLDSPKQWRHMQMDILMEEAADGQGWQIGPTVVTLY